MLAFEVLHEVVDGFIQYSENIVETIVTSVVGIGDFQLIGVWVELPHEVHALISFAKSVYKGIDVALVGMIHCNDVVELPNVHTIDLTGAVIDRDIVASCTGNGTFVRKFTDMVIGRAAAVTGEFSMQALGMNLVVKNRLSQWRTTNIS
jgi:hypothetical protein